MSGLGDVTGKSGDVKAQASSPILSSAMKDSGFGAELISPEMPSAYGTSPGYDTVFEDQDELEQNSRTQPIPIPPRRNTQSTTQRHTNFTPPRDYLSPISVSRGSMTNFCTIGSLPKQMSLFLPPTEPEEQQTSSENFRFIFSEPGFSRYREQQIGQELRTISDFFQMKCGGYGHGYNFDDVRISSHHHHHHRMYSSSFPGASGHHLCNWEYSIKHFPLNRME